VVAIAPSEQGNDRGLAPGVVEEVERRCGAAPRRLLADAGAMTEDDILGFAKSHEHMQVFAPPRTCSETAKPASRRRYERELAREPEPLKLWRARMDSEDGKAIYRRRSNTEHAHARMKNCRFDRLPVRGRVKVTAVCLLHAVVHNLVWMWSRQAAIPRRCPA